MGQIDWVLSVNWVISGLIVVHSDTGSKFDDKHYLEAARKEYLQTKTAIIQHRLLSG